MSLKQCLYVTAHCLFLLPYLPAPTAPLPRRAQDPDFYEPSAREASGVPADHARLLRDRHVILPFSALVEMVKRVSEARKSSEVYLRTQQCKSYHYVDLVPKAVLKPAFAGTCPT